MVTMLIKESDLNWSLHHIDYRRSIGIIPMLSHDQDVSIKKA